MIDLDEGKRCIREIEADTIRPIWGWLNRLNEWVYENIDELISLAERAQKSEQQLGNLLAVMHRDGGQYQQEHGTEKACEDAIKAWHERGQLISELKEEIIKARVGWEE